MAVGATFTPYGVLSEIVASHSSGPIADDQADWQLPYLMETFGLSRDQCGKVAQRFRGALTALELTDVPLEVTYRVSLVRVDSLGQPARVDSLDPPEWHTQDVITFWLTKGDQ
jgi:hypothetical protein